MMENPQLEIAVLQTKVDSLIEKQKELTERVRANEKVVAAVTLLGTVVIAVIGAGYFAPKAEAAPTPGEWIQRMRDWKSEQERIPVDASINNALEDLWEEEEDGQDVATEQKELLQFPSDQDRQSFGWGYDRCDYRSWFRTLQEGEGKDSRC
jgi:hypothetical protein